MLRDNLIGLIQPMRISAGVDPLALSTQKQASDDRSSCLENPRPQGAESSLTENVTSPFQAEPAQNETRPRMLQRRRSFLAAFFIVCEHFGKSLVSAHIIPKQNASQLRFAGWRLALALCVVAIPTVDIGRAL